MKTKDTKAFLGDGLFCYTFSLFAINNTAQYLISYISQDTSFIQLMSFSTFGLDNVIIKSVQETQASKATYTINCFRMNDNIMLLYISGSYIFINIYDLNLNLMNNSIEINKAGSLEGNVVFF